MESTTMFDMTPTEPATLGAATATWRDRLRARGFDPEADQNSPAPEVTETPEEAQGRRQGRIATLTARWRDKLPAMYAEASIRELGDEKIQTWLDGTHTHLVLAGPVGTGKTYAAYAVGNQAVARGLWVEAWSVGDLFDALRPAATDKTAETRARHCDVLILDDLIAKASDWEAERLTLLLDSRLRDHRRTVVTTNNTSSVITELWGSRFMDRLSYRMLAVKMLGQSRRSAW